MTVEQSGLFNTPAISVSSLARSAKTFLEQRFPLQWIHGEISNLTCAASGHWYFTLKDDMAQVRCTFFRARNQWLDWRPREGMAVEVRALVTLYEARAEFQLNVQDMRLAGRGALYEAFEKLKARLAAEGLFAAERKRELPAFARVIGVITSPAAAALRDVVTTLRRRLPLATVILYPTPVQGEGAAARIAATLQLASARGECDVLILCRGGGSIEDLWCCNEEAVARAIADSTIPVISGVGHETDFTIADFVADVRAATPTGAAELASAHGIDLPARLQRAEQALARGLTSIFERHQQTLDHLERRLVDPRSRIRQQHARLSGAHHALQRIVRHRLELGAHRLGSLRQRLLRSGPAVAPALNAAALLRRRLQDASAWMLTLNANKLAALKNRLDDLNPASVLRRGYAIVTAGSGDVVLDANVLKAGEPVRIQFGLGSADATIQSTADGEI